MAKKNEIEDPFDFDEEDEEQAAEPTPEPPNPELEELREFKQVALAAQREGEISDVFEKAGYSGKLGEALVRAEPGRPTDGRIVEGLRGRVRPRTHQAGRVHADHDRQRGDLHANRQDLYPR